MKTKFIPLLMLALCSCGYQSSYKPHQEEPISLNIPYIKGDVDALLNDALVYQFGSIGHFCCTGNDAEYILQVEILSDTQSRIGFRYDRDNVEGQLEKNLLGVEDRRSITALVSLIEKRSGKVHLGPFEVSASSDYDYTDPGSPRDLLFNASAGASESIMPFSLGQLDSYEGAYDDASKRVFHKIAEKIARGLCYYIPQQKSEESVP